MCTSEVDLHGIRRSVAVTVAISRVRSGHDVRLVELSFLEKENPDDYQDLVDDFEGASTAMANITSAEVVVTTSSLALSF